MPLEDDYRIRVENCQNGQHRLHINNIQFSDGPTLEAQTVNSRGFTITSKGKLNIMKSTFSKYYIVQKFVSMFFLTMYLKEIYV